LGFSKRPPDDRADEELLGIYMATGSVPACLDVLHAHDLAGRIRLVTNDASTAVKRGLEEGVIDFTILQDPVHQGYTPVKVLHEYLLTGTAPETTWYQSPIRIMGAETESG
jgi:LacI family transcriptional regulator